MIEDLDILVIPQLSRQPINADSNYVFISQVVREVLNQRPRWSFVFAWPDKDSRLTYHEDGLFSHPRVSRVYMKMPGAMLGAFDFPVTRWYRLFQRLPVEIVWCNIPEISHLIGGAAAPLAPKRSRPVVVTYHHYSVHKSMPNQGNWTATRMASQVAGSVGTDWNVFGSEHGRRMSLDTARSKFGEPAAKSIMDRSTVIPTALIGSELDLEDRRDPEMVKIIYNHRLLGYKRWKETFAVLDQLHEGGLKFQVLVTSPDPRDFKKVSRPYVRGVHAPARSEYLKALASADLNVTNSQHEMFCISLVESMALGQPIVAPNSVTFPEITAAKDNGYPYLYNPKDLEDEKNKLARLITDAAERKKWGEVLRNHVRRTYNAKAVGAGYAELFEKFADRRKCEPPADAADFFRNVVKRYSGHDAKTVLKNLHQKKVNGRIPYGTSTLPMKRFVTLLRYLGGRLEVENGVYKVIAPDAWPDVETAPAKPKRPDPQEDMFAAV